MFEPVGRSIGELNWLVAAQQRSAARNRHAERRDDGQQNHVAVFFANSHAGQTRKGEGWFRLAATGADDRSRLKRRSLGLRRCRLAKVPLALQLFQRQGRVRGIVDAECGRVNADAAQNC